MLKFETNKICFLQINTIPYVDVAYVIGGINKKALNWVFLG